MCAFWSSVMLSSGRDKGQPLATHVRIADIERAHFARWLALFGETADETCTAMAAELVADRASRFAQSFQVGIALHRAAAPLPASSSAPAEVKRSIRPA